MFFVRIEELEVSWKFPGHVPDTSRTRPGKIFFGGGEVGDRTTLGGDRTILRKKFMGGFEISRFDTSGIKVFFFDLKSWAKVLRDGSITTKSGSITNFSGSITNDPFSQRK